MVGRSFLLGIALGIVIGIYVSPLLDRPSLDLNDVSQAIASIGNRPERLPDASSWPTKDEAKSELFRISKWDISVHGEGSTVAVRRCIIIGNGSMACELSAHLSWLDDENLMEAVFKGAPGHWRMAAVKSQ
ncbi:hypothetical protein [Ochrobactrum sp. 3-3]|uniref:hypothetical protein n=1 Tax=Ochrobactrum sp. 3-3 TaxID=1830124 RepID=UPI000DEF59F8|nr:hypothetical protein [Ochrobactrum sp. 3-3]